MAEEPRNPGAYPGFVTKIIASYVSHHTVTPEQIPDLIHSVHRAIGGLDDRLLLCFNCLAHWCCSLGPKMLVALAALDIASTGTATTLTD